MNKANSSYDAKTLPSAEWRGMAVSMIGNGHIRREMPCQDVSAAVVTPRPALIVCDGRGSAKAGLSQEGSRAAVRAFCAQLNVLEPTISEFLDREDLDETEWRDLCRIFYRTLVQAKLECSDDFELPENEFDFTAAFVVVGRAHVGCFQVGDGAIVLRRGDRCETVFKPEKGEFANLTQFVRSGGEAKDEFLSTIFPAEGVTGIAATSDGPQHLMFNLVDMVPGPIFHALFDRMANDELDRDDVVAYLTRRQWADDPRGDDDRSVALLCPIHGLFSTLLLEAADVTEEQAEPPESADAQAELPESAEEQEEPQEAAEEQAEPLVPAEKSEEISSAAGNASDQRLICSEANF